MLYHKYDPVTFLYLDSVETNEQPENSVSGRLPDQTQYYTLKYVNNEWVSSLRPEYVIVDNQIKKVDLPALEQPIDE